LGEGSSGSSERHDQIGRAMDKEGSQIIDKLVFRIQLLSPRGDHGEILDDQGAGSTPLQLLPKHLGILAPGLEVLTVGVKDQDGLGLRIGNSGLRRSEHRQCHDKPDQPSR
jgi:hypothetical protein